MSKRTPPPGLAARTRDVYRAVAEIWDRDRNRTLFERPWLDRVRAAIPPDGRVLDIGCGGGDPIARYFIENGHRLTGVDFAPEMLDIARRRFPDAAWIEADMRALALPDRFDAVLAFNSFFHLTAADQRKMFPIFARHLNPGGVLFFSSGPGAGEVTGTVGGESVYHASLAPDDYRTLLTRQGFTDIHFTPEDPDCAGHSLWLATCQP